ncbi:MAG: PDZ domain-containing protein, partial [Gemmatimonadales bacterium]
SGNFSPDQMLPMMRDQVFLRVGSPLGDMEFAPVNPDLGRYFGVADGILVLSVPDSSPLPLKAGDVILTVGDRKPNTVSKLLGILQTYDDGESVTLDVMRDHKHVAVTAKANWSQPGWMGGLNRSEMKLRTQRRD